MGCKAAIFDMDGTLVATKPYHLQAWREMRAEGLINVSDDEILRTFGQTNEAIPDYVGEMKGVLVNRKGL